MNVTAESRCLVRQRIRVNWNISSAAWRCLYPQYWTLFHVCVVRIASAVDCDCHLTVFLPAGCHEAATCRYCFYSVARNQNFDPYELDQKMVGTFYDGHDELYHHTKFGGDRTTCAGCRCKNMVFVFCLFFGHTLSPEHCAFEGYIHACSLNKHCVAVYRPISTRFSTLFSEGIARSQALHSSHFRR